MTDTTTGHKEQVREYFDTDAQHYEDRRYTSEYRNCHQYSYLVRKMHVLNLLEKPAGSILDIGCGPGIYTKELLERDFRVTGIDISPKMIERARGKFSGEIERGTVTFSAGEIYDLEGMEGVFDAALCIGVISYIPLLGRFLDKLNSLLKPGGYAIIQISKKLSPKSLDEQIVYPLLRSAKGLFRPGGNSGEWKFKLRRYRVRRFNDLCTNSGFELEEGIHFDYTLPLLNILAQRLSLSLARSLESKNSGIIQALLAGDYAARYRKAL